jgi:NADPH-dependent glutamate synthase beta subunit-like oxidoreductase/ferredoxin
MEQRNFVPPCQAACPAFTDVQGYVSLAALGRFAEAYDVARLTNPFATSCGYVCFHPCEQNCRRGGVDEPVSIMELKRAASSFGVGPDVGLRPPRDDEALRHCEGAERPSQSTIKQSGKKVAVIGAGPAGLTAAQDLVSQGYDVTVFEREPKAGGMLRLTIPNYRLPDDALDRDISLIEDSGVKIEYGRELDKDLKLDDLMKTYDAVIVATGLPLSRSLPVFPAAGSDILLALPFLKAVKAGNPPALKDRVIVVGGGNVAIDVARSAVRLGKQVDLVCLEARDEMPAHDWEIEEAAEEGVKMNCCLGPAEVLTSNARIGGLRCQVVASVFDAEGRFNPTFVANEFAEIAGETIIIAIGQSRDTTAPYSGVVLNPDQAGKGIFTAGEFAEGPGSAIKAVQSGHIAAAKAMAYLAGENTAAQSPSRAKSRDLPEPEELSELTERMKPLVAKRDRVRATARKSAERSRDFGLFEPGLSETGAVKEALRCMACLSGAVVEKDKCIACLTCVRVCPFEIPKIGTENIAVIDTVECQACGQCVTECPAAAISLSRGQVERLLKETAAAAEANKTVEFFCLNSLKEGEAISAQGRIPVTCAAQISELTIYKAFENGAAKVVITVCPDGDCLFGLPAAAGDVRERLFARVDSVKTVLSGLGMDPDSVEIKE